MKRSNFKMMSSCNSLLIILCFFLSGSTIAHSQTIRVLGSDSISVPSFALQLLLSDSAKKLISDSDAKISIGVMFQGIPLDSTDEEYFNYGSKTIGDFLTILEKGETAVNITDAFLQIEDYELLADKNYEVLVNVTAFSESIIGNLISVNALQLPIDEMKGKTFELYVKVIGEK